MDSFWGLNFHNQWGLGKTFPISFSNNGLRVIATVGYGGTAADSNDDLYVNKITLTDYTVYRNKYNTYFYAIGY